MTPALSPAPSPCAPLLSQWHAALRDVILRHPNGISRAVLRLIDGDRPQLYIGLDATTSTDDPTRTMRDFAISTVTLTYFPGARLAQAWLAAGWVGYLQHEALELVTLGDLRTKVLDPHAQPYPTNPLNRGLRDGFPVELTPITLFRTLLVVMSERAAIDFVNEDREAWLGM